MQKRIILKYEKLIKEYKRDYLSYKRMLKRKLKMHDNCIEPFEYRNGKKIIYPVSDNSIYQIMGFALKIRDYKLALKNLK